MLYYHFGGKRDLYRALLRTIFGQVSTTLEGIASNGATPDVQLRDAIGAMAAFVQTERHFPAIMLREVADGGAHLDAATLETLGSIPQAIATIIGRGVAAGRFRPVQPIAAYFSIVAPLVVFMAGAPIRREMSGRRSLRTPMPDTDAFVQHVQDLAARMLCIPKATGRTS